MTISRDKAIYTAFCEKYAQDLPVFYTAAYLNAVCGLDKWEVILAMEKDEVKGILPYYRRKKFGLSAIIMPKITPYLGIWMPKGDKNMDYKTIASSLIKALPKTFYTSICMYPGTIDWLPWKWLSFMQQNRYTYIFEAKTPQEAEAKLGSKLKNHLRYASDKITVKKEKDVASLYNMITDSFDSQGKAVPFTKTMVENLVFHLGEKAVIYQALNDKGEVQAAMMTVEDAHTVYNLLSGRKKEAERGVVPLLLWTAIQQAIDQKKTFDFEGSSIENIEVFYRSFGGTLTPFLHVFKSRNRFSDALLTLLGKLR